MKGNNRHLTGLGCWALVFSRLGVFQAFSTYHIFKLLMAYQDTLLQQAKRSICFAPKGSVCVWGGGCMRVGVYVWSVYVCGVCRGCPNTWGGEARGLFSWQVDSLALILLFWDKVSHSTGWLQSHWLTKTDLQLMILLSLPLKSWSRGVHHSVPVFISHGRDNSQQASQWLCTSVTKQSYL